MKADTGPDIDAEADLDRDEEQDEYIHELIQKL